MRMFHDSDGWIEKILPKDQGLLSVSCLVCGFTPQSTAIAILRPVNLTTLFPGQA